LITWKERRKEIEKGVKNFQQKGKKKKKGKKKRKENKITGTLKYTLLISRSFKIFENCFVVDRITNKQTNKQTIIYIYIYIYNII
jgi:hypothetical protein